MRLLIAEDEDYTREGLMDSLPWQEYGISEIMQARDGSEALKISLWFKPDIVLTDIRMPKLSGIEFAQRLTKQCPDSKILFISGYLDISYLKSAIQLSAVDYIEKPLNPEAVKAAVKKAVDSINEKRRQGMIFEKKNELQMQKLASTLRYQNKDKALIYSLCKEIGLLTNSNYIVIVLWDREKLRTQEENIGLINDFWKRNGCMSICAFIEHDEYFTIIEFKNGEEKKIHKLCESFSMMEKSFCVGMGFRVDNLMSVSESYKVALFNANRGYYNTEKNLFVMDDKILNTKNLDHNLFAEFDSIIRYTPRKLKQWLEQLFSKMGEKECYPREHVKSLFVTFAKTMLKGKQNIITRIDGLYDEEDVERFLSEANTLLQVKNLMLELAAEYEAEIEKGYGYSKTVRGAIEFIDAHYTQVDLGIEAIAEFVHLSSAHLSVLFKQETGVTLKQYIGDYRLELSKKLLASELYKINEIAELCGYSNSSYFAKVFKAATGLSPVEYRNQWGIENIPVP